MGRIQIPVPLRGLKESCEVRCVAGCCGLDAFDFAAAQMVPWLGEQNVHTALLALTQLETLIAEVNTHRARVTSEQHDFYAAWRTPEECITFLEVWFREAVKALAAARGVTLNNPAWQSSLVVALARTIRKECAFDRLPILADALEEAGCTSAELLIHCRQPGEHVRGCWAVDLVLGKS